HKLGGRVPRALHDPLARSHQAGSGVERDHQRARLAADFARCGWRPDVKDKLLKGYSAACKTFKVHLDGYNQLPYLTNQGTLLVLADRNSYFLERKTRRRLELRP